MMKFIKPVALLVMALCVGVTQAQNAVCPAVVENALASAGDVCAATGRNQACYGHLAMTAQPQPDVSNFSFQQVGDIVDVAALRTLQLTPLDEAAGTWGVALMRLQANIPDTLPGQNVTFLMFGDVEIEAAPLEADASPLSAFYLRTGVGDAACAEAPESGLIVQTPEGIGEISLTINEVNVSLGSTILFQAERGGDMRVSALEGSALVEAHGHHTPVVAGTWARVPINERLQALDVPSPPLAYQREEGRNMPLTLLERRISVREPLTEREVEGFRRALENGQLPCGGDAFLECDNWLAERMEENGVRATDVAELRDLFQNRRGSTGAEAFDNSVTVPQRDASSIGVLPNADIVTSGNNDNLPDQPTLRDVFTDAAPSARRDITRTWFENSTVTGAGTSAADNTTSAAETEDRDDDNRNTTTTRSSTTTSTDASSTDDASVNNSGTSSGDNTTSENASGVISSDR